MGSFWTGLALALVPVLVGALLGGIVRRALPSGSDRLRNLCWIGAALLIPGMMLAAAFVVRVGIWDLTCTAALFSIAFSIFLGAPDDSTGWQRLLLSTVAIGVAAGLVELLLRGPLGMRPFPPSRLTGVASVTFELLEPVCEAIYSPAEVIARRVRDRDRPVVLHLGDSMVWGTGAGGPDAAFPRRLEELNPEHSHVNAGFRGSSTDGQWLVSKSWLPLLAPKAIVHYVFLGNDIHELDRACICCDMQQLVDYEGGPHQRCGSANYHVPLRERLELAPAPYLVRAAALHSAFAAQIVGGFAKLGPVLVGTGLGGHRYGYIRVGLDRRPEVYEHFGLLESVLRDDAESIGARFVVVLLVSRQTVTRSLGGTPRAHDSWDGDGMAGRDRVLSILRANRIDVIDTLEFMQAVVGLEDSDSYFASDTPGDFHFSGRGHERFAGWLWPQLQERF